MYKCDRCKKEFEKLYSWVLVHDIDVSLCKNCWKELKEFLKIS